MAQQTSPTIFVLPGAGGDAREAQVLGAGFEAPTRFQGVTYPGWRRYVLESYSFDALADDVVDGIVAKAPDGPVHLFGYSLGGHLGYACALRLRSLQREVAGLCAVDAFILERDAPQAGWLGRHATRLAGKISKSGWAAAWRQVRSLGWRALLRACGDGLPALLRRLARSSWLVRLLAADPVLEQELDIRLLARHMRRWQTDVAAAPAQLDVPTYLLRPAASADDDAAWRRRCPRLVPVEITGDHLDLYEPENIGTLRRAFAAATGWARLIPEPARHRVGVHA